MSKPDVMKKEKKNRDDKDKEEKPIVAKTASDLQRLKLQKLMKNPVSEINIERCFVFGKRDFNFGCILGKTNFITCASKIEKFTVCARIR